jgi:hypothetical protein
MPELTRTLSEVARHIERETGESVVACALAEIDEVAPAPREIWRAATMDGREWWAVTGYVMGIYATSNYPTCADALQAHDQLIGELRELETPGDE